ncbi:MAG TPA: 50S ribosomal protein L25 [Atopostipes sp.]|nr:50S ribosomal protein L25 [Atopostipes sp.]
MKILAEKRTTTGTSASKKARAAGKLPAVIYGSSVESLPVLVDLKEFEDTIRAVGANGVFSLDIDGEVYKVFVKDTASYALTPKLYHIDLQAFTAGEKVTMTIPVYVVGEENIQEGNVSQSISEIDIEIAPEEAPTSFDIDVSSLEIGDSVVVSDIELPEGAELLSEEDLTVLSVLAPEDISEDLEPTEGAAEMPEPEVIGADEEDEE